MFGAPCGARNGWMVGACALRASRTGGDATLAWGMGNTVRLLIGVCARAPVIVPNAATIAVLAVVKSSVRRFIADLPYRAMLQSLRNRRGGSPPADRAFAMLRKSGQSHLSNPTRWSIRARWPL